jgi:hypothetical protein
MQVKLGNYKGNDDDVEDLIHLCIPSKLLL